MLKFVKNRIHYLNFRSKPILFIFFTLVVLFVGLLDYLSGFYLSFSLFYLLPILYATKLGGFNIGLLICFESACVWLLADIIGLHEYPYFLLPLWNAFIRFCIFVIVSYTYWMMHYNKERQKEMIEFVVHDLRSPLANLKLSLMLLKEKAPSMNVETEKLFDITTNAANRMDMMVSSILDLSRLENKKMPLHCSAIRIQDVFRDSLNLILNTIEKKRMRVEENISPGVNSVYTDKDLVARVLVNLLSNAIKASPENSTLHLSCIPIEKGVAISVEDGGIGIPGHLYRKVFNKFFQVESRGSGIRVGSGIGLNFCYAAVKALGGRIWAEGGHRHGSKFTFTLPDIHHGYVSLNE